MSFPPPLKLPTPIVAVVLLCSSVSADVLPKNLNPTEVTEVFVEQNGLLIIEAESVTPIEDWTIVDESDVSDATMAGASGGRWLEWRGAQFLGNTKSAAEVTAIRTYWFRIHTAGNYTFRWRSKQYSDVATFDAGNDTYVRFATADRVTGTFDFSNFTKVWVQSPNNWSWRTTGEPEHGEHFPNAMRRSFEPGVHALQIAARSPGHAIDRIVLHRSSVSFNETQFTTTPESPRSAAPANMVNLSTRGWSGTGDQVMIGGLVLTGEGSAEMLLQGTGPELGAAPFNLPNTMPDPQLTLRQGATTVAANADWEDDNATAKTVAATRTGAFAQVSGSRSARLLEALTAGAYTATLDDADGAEGLTIFEAYLNPPDSTALRLSNISTRGPIGDGDRTMIGGFVITGDLPQQVLIQAIGPELGEAPFNLPGTLQNPLLILRKGETEIARNDNWDSTDAIAKAAAAATVGAPSLPVGSKSSRLLVTLSPGIYTVSLTGADDESGIGILEIYAMPSS